MQKQQGMTFTGMVFTIAVLVMGAILVMRVVPVYLNYFSIIESIKGLNSIPQSSLTGDSLEDIAVLRSSLDKRLSINGVEGLKENQLTIKPKGTNKFIVTLHYQVVKPLISHLNLLFNFDHTEEVVIGSER